MNSDEVGNTNGAGEAPLMINASENNKTRAVSSFSAPFNSTNSPCLIKNLAGLLCCNMASVNKKNNSFLEIINLEISFFLEFFFVPEVHLQHQASSIFVRL